MIIKLALTLSLLAFATRLRPDHPTPVPSPALSTPPTSSRVGWTVALFAPQSGSRRPQGLDLERGAQLALQEGRAALLARGLDLSLAVYDDGARKAALQDQARRVLRDPAVLVAIGSQRSEATVALATVFKSGPSASGAAFSKSESPLSSRAAPQEVAPRPLALIVPSPADSALTRSGFGPVARIIASNEVLAKATGRYLVRVLHARRVVLIHDYSDDGYDANSATAHYLKVAGVPALVQLRTSERSSYLLALQKLRAQHPDAVVLSFSSPLQSALFLRELRRAGIQAPVLGLSVLEDPSFVTLAGPAAAGVGFVSYAAPLEAYSRVGIPRFLSAYRAAYRTQPSAQSLLGYDAARLALR